MHCIVHAREVVVAAATLAGGFKRRRISILEFVKQLALSSAAVDAIKTELRGTGAAEELFRFDVDEFKSHIGYRSVELSNGGMLTAETDKFENVFHKEETGKGRVRFSTEGEIVNEKLRKSR